jgi:hypothetical protein
VSRAQVVVQAIAGREQITRATCWALDGIGGASKLPAPPVLYWTGADAPAFDLPPGWTLLHDVRAPQGHRRDHWRMLQTVPEGADLVVYEDDVMPCRNAVVYMAAWPQDVFTTFYRAPNQAPAGAARLLDPRMGFWGTLAIKIPARLVQRLAAAPDSTNAGKLPKEGADTRVGRLLEQWREPVYYHRSLVQHVGVQSLCNPGATLTGWRTPARDFDPDLDALELQR